MTHWVGLLLTAPPLAALGVIALLVFGEAALLFGFVLPGETAVLYGGVLASTGRLSLALLLAVVVGCAILGDSVGFEVGRRLGPRLVDVRPLRRHRSRLEAAQRYLRERGGRAVLIGRATAFLRAVMPALAGASRMHYPRFFAFNALGGVVWGTACVLLGYTAGSSLQQVASWLGATSAAVIALAVAGALVGWHLRRRRAERGQPGTATLSPAAPATDGPGVVGSRR